MVVIDVSDTGTGAPGPDPDPSGERRVVDALLRCVARWGLTKTTLDDVAREAGCSRATVYRLFPGGRDAIVLRAVALESLRFHQGLAGAVAGTDDLEEVVVAGVTYAARFLRDHDALRFLLAHEPELLLPRIAFAHMSDVLRALSGRAAPLLAPFVGDAEAPRAAEWLARIVLSYEMAPDPRVDLCDSDAVRALVRDFVLPGLISTGAASPTGTRP
jgi:AcrR family transcriptional regulator